MMKDLIGLFLLSLLALVLNVRAIFPEFNDQLLYEIVWRDSATSFKEESNVLKEEIFVTTKENERYQCAIPVFQDDGKREFDVSDAASPEILLSDVLLGETRKCSYRLEPFWTYELCHGEKITQYHEEKNSDGGISKTDFSLGKLNKVEVREILSNSNPQPDSDGKRSVPVRKIDDKETPFYSITMDNGSPCELSSLPRKTTVLYICHPTSNNEIMSVKEVTTCEYEIIVLTPTLCANPAYQVKAKPVQSIECRALEGSPQYPLSLENHEKEEIKRKFIIDVLDSTQQQKPEEPQKTVLKPSVDKSINIKFLKGAYCLVGGSGWWQYEFCHGRHVIQFHEEYGRPKTLIKLGFWNKEKHLEYIKSKKLKAKGKNHVLHFYSGGEKCDLTGKPRQAVVKLICKEGIGQQLAIYMTEEETCKYTVGVESPILCPLIRGADEFGLFNDLE